MRKITNLKIMLKEFFQFYKVISTDGERRMFEYMYGTMAHDYEIAHCSGEAGKPNPFIGNPPPSPPTSSGGGCPSSCISWKDCRYFVSIE